MEHTFGSARLAEEARQDQIAADSPDELDILRAEIEASDCEMMLAVMEGVGWDE